MKEPTNNLDDIVPGRLTSAELRAMALRQQQQIDSQHQLLATKEQRLRFLKSQEVRSAVANAEGERLRRLRERVEAQESKLRRLRALRGQVDLQKNYNVTLSNDLDSIRALFSEKEKELSLAVAKVEALTRQLEDLRRDRRGPIGLISTGNGAAPQNLPPQASRELEKLRKELMYRNQLSLQQDARLHMQREALQQRQAELRSVDQRIFELQTRLQRKKAANIQQTSNPNQHHHQNQNQHQHQQQQQQLHVQTSNHLHHSQQPAQPQPPQQHQAHQQQQQQQQSAPQQNANHLAFNHDTTKTSYQSNLVKQGGVAALKQQLLAKQALSVSPVQQQQQNQQQIANNFGSREMNRNIPRGNIAAVEPYIHTPQKSAITSTSNFINGSNILKHAAATANTNQQNQLITDLSHVKLNLNHANSSPGGNQSPNYLSGESDESKLAKKMLTASLAASKSSNDHIKQQQDNSNNNNHIYAEVGPKKRDLVKEVAANLEAQANHNNSSQPSQPTSKIPKSISSSSSASALISKLNSASASHQSQSGSNREKLNEKDHKSEISVTSETLMEKQTHQLTVHSMPLGSINKSVAVAVTTTTSAITSHAESLLQKPKSLQHLQTSSSSSSSNIAIPPRKPISSVAPTSVTSSIPKMISYSPKVNRVAPSIVTSTLSSNVVASSTTSALTSSQEPRPALPPKPNKMSPNENSNESSSNASTNPPTLLPSALRKSSPDSNIPANSLQNVNINDNLPIKAKPLTIRKQPLSEQPRLKSATNALKSSGLPTSRKIDMPSASALLFNETTKSCLKDTSSRTDEHNSNELAASASNVQHSPSNISQSSSNVDEPDRATDHHQNSSDLSNDISKRTRTLSAPTTAASNNSSSISNNSNNNNNGKPKLTRRVSFDPLALLLDASLEGELELVKKTAMQVANPSAANDEGITALHNAICAGHFDIVKFLVEFGCDVNAQDSDGWTPLHCAASCNNLAMVKFLVESGACLFAATLSDHETPAEKCEEDEEGFDGCSEYLYSIQEKLGILHSGKVYAVFSYEAQNSDELTFEVNDRLTILRKGDDSESEWWWAKNTNDEEGYVPRNLLGLCPRVPPQPSNFTD